MSCAARHLLTLGWLISLTSCARFISDSRTVQMQVNPTRDPKVVAEAYEKLCKAEKFFECGKLDHAEKRLLEAIQLDPELGPAHNNLGLIYFERRQLYDAAHAFQRAKELMPRSPLPYNNLGMALERGGKMDEAIYNFEQAYTIDPRNPEFLGNLIRARRVQGDLGEDVDFLLKELIFVESRPGWVEWALDELNIMLPKEREKLIAQVKGQQMSSPSSTGGSENREPVPGISTLPHDPLEPTFPIPPEIPGIAPLVPPVPPEPEPLDGRAVLPNTAVKNQ